MKPSGDWLAEYCTKSQWRHLARRGSLADGLCAVQHARDEDDTHPHLIYLYRLRNVVTGQIVVL